MKLTRVGVDLAKQVFQVHGVDRSERAVWCKRLKRARWISDLESEVEPGAEIGIGACGREQLLGISKRGDSYVHTLCAAHGARQDRPPQPLGLGAGGALTSERRSDGARQ
jgi:hypothetical protein